MDCRILCMVYTLSVYISKDTLPCSCVSIRSFCFVYTLKIILGLKQLSVLDSLNLQRRGYTATLKTSSRKYCSCYEQIIKKVCLESEMRQCYFLFWKLRMCLTGSTHSQMYQHLTKKKAAEMQRHETDDGLKQSYKSFYMKKD